MDKQLKKDLKSFGKMSGTVFVIMGAALLFTIYMIGRECEYNESKGDGYVFSGSHGNKVAPAAWVTNIYNFMTFNKQRN